MQTNFQELQAKEGLFSNGNRIAISKDFVMECVVEGTPRPEVFWRLRKNNGDVVYADCIHPQYAIENGIREQRTSQPVFGEISVIFLPALLQTSVFRFI